MPSRPPRRLVVSGGGFRPITSRELSEWAAYERVAGPLGQERDDLHAAQVAAMIANVHRKKGQRPYRLDEMALKWDRGSRRQTPEQHLTILKALAAAYSSDQ